VSTQSGLPHLTRTDHAEVPLWRGRDDRRLAVGHLALEFVRVTKDDARHVDGPATLSNSALTCPTRVARILRGRNAIVSYESPATGGTCRCVTEVAS
jgi:hypothetical protein